MSPMARMGVIRRTPMVAPPARTGGFTLLEVMVALVIIALAMIAVIRAVGDNAGNAAYLRERTLAHWVAMNKVFEFQLSDEWPGAGRRTGTELMAESEWFWEAQISNTEDPDVRRMDMRVYRQDGDDSALALIVAYLGKP